jgi:hypothetical protein
MFFTIFSINIFYGLNPNGPISLLNSTLLCSWQLEKQNQHYAYLGLSACIPRTSPKRVSTSTLAGLLNFCTSASLQYLVYVFFSSRVKRDFAGEMVQATGTSGAKHITHLAKTVSSFDLPAGLLTHQLCDL